MDAFGNSGKAETVAVLFGRGALWGVGVSSALAIGLGATGGLHPLAVVAAIVLAGVGVASLVFSLRHYTWLWWLCWLVPVVPVVAVLEEVRFGTISMVAVTFAYSLAFALMFGTLIAARNRLRKWVA